MTFWLSVLIYVTLHVYCLSSHPFQNLIVSPFMINKSKEDENEKGPESTTVPEDNKKNSTCFCSKIYDPVCGSDNRSYYNLCRLQCTSHTGALTPLHQGNCIPFRY